MHENEIFRTLRILRIRFHIPYPFANLPEEGSTAAAYMLVRTACRVPTSCVSSQRRLRCRCRDFLFPVDFLRHWLDCRLSNMYQMSSLTDTEFQFDLDHLSLPPIVQAPSMIGEPWVRSMSANMILFLDAA